MRVCLFLLKERSIRYSNHDHKMDLNSLEIVLEFAMTEINKFKMEMLIYLMPSRSFKKTSVITSNFTKPESVFELLTKLIVILLLRVFYYWQMNQN